MPRRRWKMVQPEPGKPEVEEYGDEPARVVSLLAEVAKDPASGLEEVAPGRYWARKDNTTPDR